MNNVGEFRAVRDIAVVPLDLSYLPPGDEDEKGVAETQGNVQLSKRRISNGLMEVSL